MREVWNSPPFPLCVRDSCPIIDEIEEILPMANTYRATEFTQDTWEKTGKVEYYLAIDIEGAIKSCLYTHYIHNGNAKLGPTGRVVYCGKLAYPITLDE